jgi:hypothetical protein
MKLIYANPNLTLTGAIKATVAQEKARKSKRRESSRKESREGSKKEKEGRKTPKPQDSRMKAQVWASNHRPFPHKPTCISQP